MRIIHIDAPHFCAGVLLNGDVVVRAAPILKYMKGWTWHRVMAYCDKKRWVAYTEQLRGDHGYSQGTPVQ